MNYSVNIHSSVAVYMQIENHIRFAIAAGSLKAGDRLPTVRHMTETLGVNPNTITKAYRDLEVMGLVYGRRGAGVFVHKGVQAKCRATCFEELARRLHEVAQEAKAAAWSKGDLAKVVSASYAAKGGPYEEVPKKVLALAK